MNQQDPSAKKDAPAPQQRNNQSLNRTLVNNLNQSKNKQNGMKNQGIKANEQHKNNPNDKFKKFNNPNGMKKNDNSQKRQTNQDKQHFKPYNNTNNNSSSSNNFNQYSNDNIGMYANEKKIEKKFTGRCRLFVGNLPSDMTEVEFKELFTKFGEVGEVFLNPSRSFGFIKLVSFQDNDLRAAKST
jgi:hypothetical protein